jgi:hypothetical protein
MPTRIKAYPEWLQRNDVPLSDEKWEVTSGPAARGEAWTDIKNRRMRIPTIDDDVARVIRAHEMIHAKVSPANGVVVPTSLGHVPEIGRLITSCEEARVNYLAHASGYDMGHLKDGGEKSSGERAARHGDLNHITLDVVASIGTGGLNPYISGVRKAVREGHAEPAMLEHAMQVKKIASRTIRRWTDTHGVASTYNTQIVAENKDGENGLVDIPQGYRRTLYLAEQLADLMIREPGKSVGDVPRRPDMPDGGTRGQFAVPVLEKLPLTERVAGRLGRKRIATNIGRDPRRINRMLTDPDRRIFDRRARNIGGVIVIDQSGSMHLEDDDLWQIIKASPGCVVIGYSHEPRSTGVPNIWLIADRGRVANHVPSGRGGNGVDGPALLYGLSKRKGREPFIWVCDGYVTDYSDSHSSSLDSVCVDLVKRNDIHMVPDVAGAIDALNRVGRGETLRAKLVGHLVNRPIHS